MNLNAWFRQSDAPVPAGLLSRTMVEIGRLERRRLGRRRLFWPLIELAASTLALVYAVPVAWSALVGSDVGEFFLTAAADWRAALVAWQDLALSIVEALPVTELTLALAAALFFLGMIRRVNRLTGPATSLKGI